MKDCTWRTRYSTLGAGLSQTLRISRKIVAEFALRGAAGKVFGGFFEATQQHVSTLTKKAAAAEEYLRQR